MRYLVTGATSGTGVAVMRRLVEKVGTGKVACLVRPASDAQPLVTLGVRIVVGDVRDLSAALSLVGSPAAYLDMTNPRYYSSTINSLVSARVERAFFVTTTGIFSRYRSCADVYKEAEALVLNSGIVSTILRPTMIYGNLKDRNMNKLIRVLSRTPVFPLFGARSLMQPVFTDDLADGIVASLLDPACAGQDYNLAGPAPISYREIVSTIVGLLRRHVLLVPVNLRIAWLLVKMLQWLPGFPIKDEQVLRLGEDKVFDISKAQRDLGFRPRSFEQGIAAEIEMMQSAHQLSPVERVRS
jgi:uncharacterized protein YbjT (DUF2867 family)